MTGIDFPEIGNTPDCEPESAEPQYYDAKKDSGTITWYEDGEYMDKTDAFKVGKEYTVLSIFSKLNSSIIFSFAFYSIIVYHII